MELTDRHIEKIREVVRMVDYGSVTINISADSNKLDLNVQNRMRFEIEPEDTGYSSKPVTIPSGKVQYVKPGEKPKK